MLKQGCLAYFDQEYLPLNPLKIAQIEQHLRRQETHTQVLVKIAYQKGYEALADNFRELFRDYKRLEAFLSYALRNPNRV